LVVLFPVSALAPSLWW